MAQNLTENWHLHTPSHPDTIIEPDKTRPASSLNGFKNIPQKAGFLGVRTKVGRKLWGEYISLQEKQAMLYQFSFHTKY